MERVARAVRPLSTAPEDDLLIIVKRALFAWLIADGDMHLKSMALFKIAEPGEKQFRSVRMPEAIEFTDDTRKMTAEVLDICRRRIEAMTQQA